MADTAAKEPDLAELMQALALEDNAERLRRTQAEVCPVLADVLKDTTEVAREIYGDGWLDLIGVSQTPAPRDTGKSKIQREWAEVAYTAKGLQSRPYRVSNQRGQRSAGLYVKCGLMVTAAEFRAQLSLTRRAETMLFEEVWRAYHSECAALLQAGAPDVWAGDVDLPGPPFVTLETQVDMLLQSQAAYLFMSSRPTVREDSWERGFQRARWGFLCLLPVLVGVIEAALSRQPSVGIFHQRLCQHLAREEHDGDTADGWAHISSALRYQVLQRDGFRCVMCGATAGSGATLEVDHILPRAKGGKHVLDNLQTLCDRCNRGKGANLSPDLRAR